jgi:NTE family protein
MDFFKSTGQGMYLKIGNSAESIARKSNCSEELYSQLTKQCLAAEQAGKAMNYPTTLKKPSESNLQLMLRHGYEVADCTYRCYEERKDG